MARHNIKKTIYDMHTCSARQLRDTEDRLARFTRRASSSPALLALRERPARYSPPSSCDKDWGEKHKHKRSDNVVVSVAVRAVQVVMRQLVRGNAHVVLVLEGQKKPRKRRPSTCVLYSQQLQGLPRREADRSGTGAIIRPHDAPSQ